MNRRRTCGLRAAVAVVAVAALVAGCGSSDDNESDPQPGAKERTYQEGMIGEDSAGDPAEGGTLDFGAFAEPTSLDPGMTIAAGSTGGVEMAAIYDTLMRYDTESQEFVPRLAESLEGNDDGSEWTLKLRDGVQFSDGTPLDSAAVKWSQERYVAKPGPEAALWGGNVTAIDTPDDLTVVYHLKGPWGLFPSILSTGPGMIVAKSSDEGGEFKPVGAGPFVLEKWAPQEEIVLAANDDYWDGRPYLDEVRSVFLSDQQTAVDSLNSGALDIAFMRDPDKVDELLDEDTGGYLNMTAASNVALINATEGRPGADPRVRQAMAMGINPDLIRERAYEGHGLADATLFPEYSRWHTATAGLVYDADAAKKLLDEAKADGYDGKLTYLDAADPASRATGLAVKASLEAIGFTVELDLKRTVSDQITAIAVNRDYDIAGWGLNYREGDPFSKMFSTLHSSGTSTYGMATSPELDALIEEFQASSDEKEQLDVMDRIQQQVNEQVPFLNWGPIAEFNAWNDDVHAVTGAMNSIVLLDKAWIG